MSTPSTTKKKSFLRKLLIFSVFVLLLMVIVVVVGFFYTNARLKSNETKILEDVEFLNGGTVSFDKIHISVWDDFPKASIVLSNVRLQDSSYAVHGEPLLEVNELHARLGTAGWRNLDFEINGFSLKDGTINLHKYPDGYDNLKSILNPPVRDTTLKDDSWIGRYLVGWISKIDVESDQLDLELNDVKVNVIDEVQSTAYVADLKSIVARLNRDKGDFDLDVDMDAHVEEITFNPANGSYFSDSDLKGSFNVKKEGNQFRAQPFDLSMNDEIFTVDGIINAGHIKPSVINLINKETDLANTIPLLPKKIREEIIPYKIKNHFPSKTEIILEQGQRARVEVLFQLIESDVEISGIRVEDASLKGRFVNRKYDDSRSRTERKGNIRLILDDVSVRQGDIVIQTEQVFIQSNPKDKANVRSLATVRGPAPTISEFYDSDKFLFKDGRFELTAEVSGPLNDLGQLILESDAQLSLSDIDVLYRPADVSIPISSLELVKASGDADFSIETSTLSRAFDYHLDGAVTDLAGLLVDFSGVSTVSNVHLSANRLGWADYIELFSRPEHSGFQYRKDEGASKQSMKTTLRGIHDKIHPRVTIAIDTFEYWDRLDMYDLSTVAYFDSTNSVILDSVQFELDQGSIALEARVDISDPFETGFVITAKAKEISLAELLPKFDYFNVQLLADQTEHSEDFDINITIEGKIHDVNGVKANDIKGSINFVSKSFNGIKGKVDFQPMLQGDSLVMHSVIDFSGSPVLFNDFFKNEQFFFEDRGRFITHFDHVGDILSFDQLIAEAEIDLDIKNGAVLYEEADIVFELSDVSTTLHGDSADYVINMRSDALDRELIAFGLVENVSELIYGNTSKQLKSKVNIFSPVINVEHAVFIFETPTDTIASFFVEKEVDNKTKSLLRGLFNRFDPDITVEIDSLIITDKIAFSDFTSGLHLGDSTTLVLEQTDFKYCGGDVRANATVYIGPNDLEPLTASVSTEDIDIYDILESLDYLDEDLLREAKTIRGILTFDLEFEGALRDLKFVDLFTDASIDFTIDSLELEGVRLLEDIGVKFNRPEQFQLVKFAPLVNTITITESRIYIPQIEIQSTAGNVFVEGHLDHMNGSNLWVTIPLDNLKKQVLQEPPSLEGYAAQRWKVHLEFSSRDNEPMEQKLRISKRQFYKKRGMLKQLRIDRRLWRQARRAAKKVNE